MPAPPELERRCDRAFGLAVLFAINSTLHGPLKTMMRAALRAARRQAAFAGALCRAEARERAEHVIGGVACPVPIAQAPPPPPPPPLSQPLPADPIHHALCMLQPRRRLPPRGRRPSPPLRPC